jgi:hypothetical protein
LGKQYIGSPAQNRANQEKHTCNVEIDIDNDKFTISNLENPTLLKKVCKELVFQPY